MWCSTFTTITRDYRRNASEFANKWRTNNLLGRSHNGWSDCFSNFSYTSEGGYEIRDAGQQRFRPTKFD
jgi:hypothetical protein